ncbi:hypothetical protein IG612_19340 [Pectobacterium sp. FL60-S17]|uniref:Uncharacterized protein n=1 Tax=Pectobacterium quasiaquaticum TaxID=2774015 RepID=A0A9Q2ICL8_9GAMM|nr:hypothetical protein [Pectobacterium quasiaquaticum]MBE5204706.1 hypothetical protein [Pectobacterium quasiaquaticum]MBE5211222.1 hypothetical protein [Pectobacterium quasiaquaticum]MBE5223602.1 hypothetical protein [Pectobacterium quasiaquaticum]URG51087.1 hypothetical protein IG609_010575 [Pectobacterium quasiaquaticum]
MKRSSFITVTDLATLLSATLVIHAQVLDLWGEDDEKITQSVVNPPGIGD